jgi:hypothetical protein
MRAIIGGVRASSHRPSAQDDVGISRHRVVRVTIVRGRAEYSDMSQTDSSAPPAHDPNKLSSRTTPTWEVELLISGVAVFAMLQLPGWLDERILMLMPRLNSTLGVPVFGLFIYATAASVILAVTFTAHLLLRAQWIALVGMHSVFPEGVRWENLRSGPILRAVEEKLVADPAANIERADNRATTVFAIGVSLATMQLVLALGIVLLFPLVYGIARLFRAQVDGALVFNIVLLLIIVPWALTVLADRLVGARLNPGGRIARAMAGLLRAYARVGFGHGSSNLGLLYGRYGRRRAGLAVGLVGMLCIGLVMLGMLFNHEGNRFGSYALFPDFATSDTGQVDSAHYDDQRDHLRDDPVPFVQSAVITDDYLRLVVPYWPDRDIAAQRAHCADALAVADAKMRAVSLLQCLTRLHAVTLDGKPLADIHFDAGGDPRTRRPALVAMIDMRALAPGRHELTVTRPQRPKHPHDPTLDTIAFWR